MKLNSFDTALRSTEPTTDELFYRFYDNVLLRDETTRTVRYGDVLELAKSPVFQATRRRLVICGINNDIFGIAGYLALLAANAVPMMISATLTPFMLEKLMEGYKPDFLWLMQQEGKFLVQC